MPLLESLEAKIGTLLLEASSQGSVLAREAALSGLTLRGSHSQGTSLPGKSHSGHIASRGDRFQGTSLSGDVTFGGRRSQDTLLFGDIALRGHRTR